MRLALAFLLATIAGAPIRAEGLSDWGVVVASGDTHAAHAERHTDAFDNARRSVADLLVKRGASPANLVEFSAQADHETADRPRPEPLEQLFVGLGRVADTGTGGCLFYITSHGAPSGVVIGPALLPPSQLAAHLAQACGTRPTAIILSACFSGGAIPALKGPNRFILTAARRDRASFGCSENDKYPYFDACVIDALPTVAGLFDLADRVRACVAKREDEENLRPRSEPQLWIGKDFRRNAPTFKP